MSQQQADGVLYPTITIGPGGSPQNAGYQQGVDNRQTASHLKAAVGGGRRKGSRRRDMNGGSIVVPELPTGYTNRNGGQGIQNQTADNTAMGAQANAYRAGDSAAYDTPPSQQGGGKERKLCISLSLGGKRKGKGNKGR